MTADLNMHVCFRSQDDKLKALVQKLGTNDWKYIASYIPVSLSLVDYSNLYGFLGYFMSA